MAKKVGPGKKQAPTKPRKRGRIVPVQQVGEESAGLLPAVAFPVVAIGASAGGLEAFTTLLNALPARSGMAFVLIQHLEPKHESALTSLLSKTTTMPVVEVSDGISVEPNHVYVIPPNKNMTIRKGILRLAPRSELFGLQRPIDDFSMALAEEQGSTAIGVVLSGTGSDGTYGLKAIKAAGGVTFAQDPETAQWSAMPMSAITAGSVDFVLSPKAIAAELARIARHPYVVDAREVPEGSELDKLCLVLRSMIGVDFRLYKQATVRRRIARRMVLQKIGSLEKYAQILKQNPVEAQALADDIFIHVTRFFRDPECFQALRKQVLAKLPLKRSLDDPIRIWVAGCSTGEEVYSIAILLLEELGDRANRFKIQIFGTDIQEHAVERARAGIYTDAAVEGVSPARLKRFFIKTETGYQIQKSIRDICVFARHDLAKDPPFSRLDLVSCRNVLIYFGPALQKRALSLFQYALKPGGFLFLGTAESISEYSDTFTVEDRKHRIFVRKLAAAPMTEFHMGAERSPGPEFATPRITAPGVAVDFRKEAETALLGHYVPPALVVDSDMHIRHIQGDTSPYMALATGAPSFHLLKMVRPELMVDLRTAIDEARRTGVPVHRDRVEFDAHGERTAVRLEVRPLGTRSGKQNFLVVFQKLEPSAYAEAKTKSGRGAAKKPGPKQIEKLQRELTATREHLRSLIAEQESSQEEMKVANEEILSSNEELQSTNEELETAKEELQSSNEELITLNNELQHHNADLAVLTHDLNNLLVGVGMPVLLLDSELRVRRFTPAAGILLNLIPADVGRPFSNIASNLNVSDWRELFSEVMDKAHAVEREVSDRTGHLYSMRIRPYNVGANEIDGVLIVLFDVDAMKRTLEEARAARDLARNAEQRGRAIMNSLLAHVAVLGADGTVLETNEAWNRFALENSGSPLNSVNAGANYLEVCKRAAAEGVADAQAAFDGIQEILAGRRETFQLEFSCHNATQRWFLMTASPLLAPAGGAVITHTNITDRKLAEVAVLKSRESLLSLVEASTQSIVGVNAEGHIQLVNGNTEHMFGYTRQELIGKPLDLLIPEAFRGRHIKHHAAYFAEMQSRPMGLGMHLEGLRKDGSKFPVEIALGAMDTADGKMGVAFVSNITQRRRIEQVEQAHAREVQALAASLLTVQEEERRRVSRELHDQICQQLASLAIDIGSLVADLPAREDAQTRLKTLQARAVKASEEARHIAYELHPSVLDDLGLVASLQSLCNEFSDLHPHIGVEFRDGIPPIPIPREVASCFYRVAQASLQNAALHGQAQQITVTLAWKNDVLLLTIADDGVGFDPAAVKGHGGLGLIGMEERARLIHGKLTIYAQPGHGTRIAIEVPLAETKP